MRLVRMCSMARNTCNTATPSGCDCVCGPHVALHPEPGKELGLCDPAGQHAVSGC